LLARDGIAISEDLLCSVQEINFPEIVEYYRYVHVQSAYNNHKIYIAFTVYSMITETA